MATIHPTAIVESGAELGENVTVGPYAIVRSQVRIGEGTSIGAHCVIEGRTTIGRDNRIFQFSSIGAVPQDKKYAGEPTELVIGDRNTIREFCTFNLVARGPAARAVPPDDVGLDAPEGRRGGALVGPGLGQVGLHRGRGAAQQRGGRRRGGPAPHAHHRRHQDRREQAQHHHGHGHLDEGEPVLSSRPPHRASLHRPSVRRR